MRSSRLPAALGAALLAAALLPAPAAAEGPPARREPWIGYAFPAGARRGTTVDLLVGGQNLAGVTEAFVTGEGVRCTVVRTVRPLDRRQQRELRRRIAEVRLRRKLPRPDDENVELPDHPMLKDLGRLSPMELRAVEIRFLGAGERQQPNVQIAETVEVRVVLDPRAPPGDREIRLASPGGITNPLRFQVGATPEVREEEPREEESGPAALPALPVLVNGQILPGDADRFLFRAKAGREVVVSVAARKLVPFLADAVPGWFQATVTLRDAAGREVGFADDWRQDPDPVLLFRVPRDGEYSVEIRDALWRGREDFVYRLSIGEEPFITRMFPLGGPLGVATMAVVEGRNLPRSRIPLDTAEGSGALRFAEEQKGGLPSNRVPFSVDDLTECGEREPNDDAARAQPLPLPRIVNGTIGRPGDVDVFRFMGFAGDEVVAEVEARRLGSPLDSLLRLTDADGSILAWNDDRPGGGTEGTVTHDADSWLRFRLPADGLYRVVVRDALGQGSEDHAYRLRVGPPRAGFDVFAVPSGVAVPAGRSVLLRLEARRRDGWRGPVDVSLRDAPPGWSLSGGRIPEGRDGVRATLTAPAEATGAPVPLRLEARAVAADGEVLRPVVPAEDVMQAFLWRHLLPAQEFTAWVTGRGRGPEPVEVLTALPLKIPAGGRALVRVRVPGRPLPGDLGLALDSPPEGVRIEETAIRGDVLAFVLHVDPAVPPGFADNLIVEASLDREVPAGRDGRGGGRVRLLAGILPALPLEVTGTAPR